MLEQVRKEHRYLMETMESEQEFILNCIENNHISMEAEVVTSSNVKKKGIFKRFIETIKGIFAKFTDAVKKLMVSMDKWISETLPKLDDVTYDGLDITLLPYYLGGGIDQMSKYIQAMMNRFKTIRETDGASYPTTADDIVKSDSVFADFRSNSMGFSQACKHVFSYGKEVPIDKASTFKGHRLTNANEIGEKCKVMRKYIETYKTEQAKLVRLQTQFIVELDQSEREYEREHRVVTDSYGPYLALENAFLGQTDLRYCDNYFSLFEAEVVQGEKGETAKQTVTSTDDKNTSNITSTQKPEEKKSNTAFITYKKNFASLITQAFAAALTVAESTVYSYRKVIDGVIREKSKNVTTPQAEESEDVKQKKDSIKDKATKAVKDKAYYRQQAAKAAARRTLARRIKSLKQ